MLLAVASRFKQLTFVPRFQNADQIHAWIVRHLSPGPKPPIYRPFNYFRIITITTTALGLVSFISMAAPYILPIVRNRNTWAGFSLITILLFTSGHMFNHIRKVPYVSGDGKGGISYFASGFSNQFGLETQIVAAMCKYIHSSQVYPSCIWWLTKRRRRPFIFHNCSSLESASYVRSEEPAICYFRLGHCHAFNV